MHPKLRYVFSSVGNAAPSRPPGHLPSHPLSRSRIQVVWKLKSLQLKVKIHNHIITTVLRSKLLCKPSRFRQPCTGSWVVLIMTLRLVSVSWSDPVGSSCSSVTAFQGMKRFRVAKGCRVRGGPWLCTASFFSLHLWCICWSDLFSSRSYQNAPQNPLSPQPSTSKVRNAPPRL